MAEKVNPAMLIVAREARGLTQAQLAERIGRSQAKVSKFEAGLLNVPDDDLASIARELEFPEAFFCQTDNVYGFGSPCFYHRRRTRMPVADLRQIQARLNIFRFHVTRLLRGAEVVTENKFIRLDVDEHGGPEQVARLVRQQWGLPLGPIANVINAVESAGAIVYSMPFGTRSLDAISQVAPGCPPLIFVNSEIPGDRLRYTLLHEVGHIIMHQIPSDDMETEADRFAAEFLMPEREVKPRLRGLRVQQLPAFKSEWRVSMAAIVKRAFDLAQISERQYRYMFMQLSSQGWRTNEPIAIETEQPSVFDKILDVHVKSHGFTIAELCRLVNAKESRFAAYLRQQPNSGLRVVG
jgi:Zn-dependent peptidase ImmA (M78 family)/transcriptional regulator with XRE-family HTH domain